MDHWKSSPIHPSTDTRRRRPLHVAHQPRSTSVVVLDVVAVVVVVVLVHGPFLDGFVTHFITALGVLVSPFPSLTLSSSSLSVALTLLRSISLAPWPISVARRVPSPSNLHLPTPPPVCRAAAHPLLPPRNPAPAPVRSSLSPPSARLLCPPRAFSLFIPRFHGATRPRFAAR